MPSFDLNHSDQRFSFIDGKMFLLILGVFAPSCRPSLRCAKLVDTEMRQEHRSHERDTAKHHDHEMHRVAPLLSQDERGTPK